MPQTNLPAEITVAGITADMKAESALYKAARKDLTKAHQQRQRRLKALLAVLIDEAALAVDVD